MSFEEYDRLKHLTVAIERDFLQNTQQKRISERRSAARAANGKAKERVAQHTLKRCSSIRVNGWQRSRPCGGKAEARVCAGAMQQNGNARIRFKRTEQRRPQGGYG